jgi:hypothetical protein
VLLLLFVLQQHTVKNNKNWLGLDVDDLLQAFERRESSEELEAPVVDKVCDLTCVTRFLH